MKKLLLVITLILVILCFVKGSLNTQGKIRSVDKINQEEAVYYSHESFPS